MKDPHVEALFYRFTSEDANDRFDEASPLASSLGPFTIELREGVLASKPSAHFPDAESAKAAFEPFLRSWEAVALLDESHFRIRFKYTNASVIDRNPDPGSSDVHFAGTADAVFLTEAITVARSMSEYPTPDPGFLTSPLTDELLNRFAIYRDGRYRLVDMAYWILTRLEVEFGGMSLKRRTAAKYLHVDYAVLDNLGRLCDIDDPLHGRKSKPTRMRRSYTRDELSWINEVACRLIRRSGEIGAGNQLLSLITMQDFTTI